MENVVISQFSLIVVLYLQVDSCGCVRLPNIFKGQWKEIEFGTVHEFNSEKLGQVWEGQDSALFFKWFSVGIVLCSTDNSDSLLLFFK